jgi:beta-galactosidase
VLKTIGKKDGKTVVTDEVRTVGSPARLVLKADRAEIKADGDDLSFVTAQVVDRDGLVCPGADQLVQFKLNGPGAIAGVDNGVPTNHEPFKVDRHKVFHGLGLAVVRSKTTAGAITVRAEAKGLAPAEIIVNTR